MPMTVTVLRVWDMMCSLSGCLWPAYRWLGREHGRTIPLADLGSAHLSLGRAVKSGHVDLRGSVSVKAEEFFWPYTSDIGKDCPLRKTRDYRPAMDHNPDGDRQ